MSNGCLTFLLFTIFCRCYLFLIPFGDVRPFCRKFSLTRVGTHRFSKNQREVPCCSLLHLSIVHPLYLCLPFSTAACLLNPCSTCHLSHTLLIISKAKIVHANHENVLFLVCFKSLFVSVALEMRVLFSRVTLVPPTGHATLLMISKTKSCSMCTY